MVVAVEGGASPPVAVRQSRGNLSKREVAVGREKLVWIGARRRPRRSSTADEGAAVIVGRGSTGKRRDH